MENNWILFAIQFGMGVIGFIFLGTAIGLDISLKRKKKKCTQLVPAVIVDIERVSYTSTDGIGMTSWFPIYEYWYQGNRIQKRALTGTSNQDFYIGQKVKLYLNPFNPNEFYCPEEKRGFLIGVFYAVGSLVFLLAIILESLQRYCRYHKRKIRCRA